MIGLLHSECRNVGNQVTGQDSQEAIQQKLPLKGTKGSLVPVSHAPAYLEKEDTGTVPKGTDGLMSLPLINILAMYNPY